MHVVAFVAHPLLDHLRVVLARTHQLVPVESWEELDERMRRSAVDIAVLDPQANGAFAGPAVEAILARYPSVPVVVYTTLSPQALPGIMGLARHGLEHVVLHRFDDEPRRLLDLLERLPGDALSSRMLERLATPLSRVSLNVARAIERLFRSPARFTGAPALASEAALERRQLYRQLHDAGFASPRVLVQSARLLRAYAYLQDPGFLIDDVAAKLGYSEPRMLNRNMREAIGLSSGDLRLRLIAPEEFVERLVHHVWRQEP